MAADIACREITRHITAALDEQPAVTTVDDWQKLAVELPWQEAVDQASAALVSDLKQRGLLDETLVIWGGEFGRTVYSQGALTAPHMRCAGGRGAASCFRPYSLRQKACSGAISVGGGRKPGFPRPVPLAAPSPRSGRLWAFRSSA